MNNNNRKIINEYGDVLLDPQTERFLNNFLKNIRKGWIEQKDPYQEQDMEYIMNEYIKYFKQKNDKIYDQNMKKKSKWKNFILNIKKLFLK